MSLEGEKRCMIINRADGNCLCEAPDLFDRKDIFGVMKKRTVDRIGYVALNAPSAS